MKKLLILLTVSAFTLTQSFFLFAQTENTATDSSSTDTTQIAETTADNTTTNATDSETASDTIADTTTTKITPTANTDTTDNANTTTETATETAESKKSSSGSSSGFDYNLGFNIGSATVDGETYQQIGLRGDLGIWKFGVGIDADVLLDADGNIRTEDWDDWQDYLDKIYYVRWGQKGDPLYIKYGGLDYTYLGYNILVDGYSNMIEYPTVKREGIDMEVNTRFIGFEGFIGNIKEAMTSNPTVMGGGRIFVKPLSFLQFGLSFAGDTNEYKGLKDSDGDGYPDEIDEYPYDSNYVTETEWYKGQGLSDTTMTELESAGIIDGTTSSDLTSINDISSSTGFWAADIGASLLQTSFLSLDLYTQFAQSLDTKGWGFTAPGIRMNTGILTVTAEYKQNSDGFLFGYYNETYDLNRAYFSEDSNGDLTIVTKKDLLEAAKEGKGYYIGANFNLFNLAYIKASYQDIFLTEGNDRSLTAKAGVQDGLIPKISEISAYYIQNDVDDILEWKTPNTVIGATIAFDMGTATTAGFDYLVTFSDNNGNGVIDGDDETNVSIQIKVSTTF